MGQSQQNHDGGRMRGAGVFLLVARALACSLEVFLHKSSSFGERYLGAQVAIAALLIIIWPAFAPEHDPQPMLWFLGAFLVMCAAARAGTVARRARGELGPHSFYTGTPRLMGRQTEKAVKGSVEPFVVWLTSALLSQDSPLLAGYLGIAGCGLLVSVQLTMAAERKRVLDMHDAYMEQRRTAEEWRATHRE